LFNYKSNSVIPTGSSFTCSLLKENNLFKGTRKVKKIYDYDTLTYFAVKSRHWPTRKKKFNKNLIKTVHKPKNYLKIIFRIHVRNVIAFSEISG
jgi:hypothetical protein